jgi:hypothetical protein
MGIDATTTRAQDELVIANIAQKSAPTLRRLIRTASGNPWLRPGKLQQRATRGVVVDYKVCIQQPLHDSGFRDHIQHDLNISKNAVKVRFIGVICDP